MGIFKITLIFFVLQLFLKSTTAGEPEISCVANGLASDYGSMGIGVINAFASFDPTPLSGFGLGLLDTAIGIWGGPGDCFKSLVKKLDEHFVSEKEFTKFKSKMDTITAEMKMHDMNSAKTELRAHRHWIKDPNTIRDYVNEFKDYLFDVSRNVEQLFRHIEDFHHPIEKMTNLILGSAYVKDLTKMSTSFAYSAYMCHHQGKCSVTDIKVYAATLEIIGDRIFVCGKYFWKVEKSLFDARKKPSSIQWTGETRGFQTPVNCRSCMRPPGGDYLCGGLKYHRKAPRGSQCAYKDNLYAHSGTVNIKNQEKWDSFDHHKEWKCRCSGDNCYRKGPNWDDGKQVCDQEGSGYPRRKRTEWLSQNQRRKLIDVFNENFNNYSKTQVTHHFECKYANYAFLQMTSCTLMNKVDKNLCGPDSDRYRYDRWRWAVACLHPKGMRTHLRRQLLTAEEEQEFCKNLNSEAVGKFVKEHGVENLPECYPVPQIAKEFVEESQRAHNITEVHDIHAIPMRNQTREFSQRIRYKL